MAAQTPRKTGPKPSRRRGPTKAQERANRRTWVLERLLDGVPVTKLYRDATSKWKVSSETIRRDLKWAAGEVSKNLGAGLASEPVRLYNNLTEVSEIAMEAGKGAIVRLPNGLLLLDNNGQPVREPDSKFLAVATKALRAQQDIMVWRGSQSWTKSLQGRQKKLQEAEIRLKEAQAAIEESKARMAVREEELEAKRRQLADRREAAGVGGTIQEIDNETATQLTRAALLGKVELSGYLTLQTRSASITRGDDDGTGQDDRSDGGEGGGPVAGGGVDDGGAGGDGPG